MRLSGLVYTVLLAACALAGAQDLSRPSASDIKLVLTCPASPCRFRLGELIPIELNFRTDAPDDIISSSPRYGILNLLNGHTERFDLGWNIETFTADPADGVVDPAGADAAGIIVAGSWNNGLDPIGKSATKVTFELNEWLYFERPGRYKVAATSRRVCPIGRAPRGWNWKDCLEAASSGPIEIEITAADPAWQRQQLERIVRELPAEKAVRELTYLGTADALAEIRKNLEAGGSAMGLSWQRARMFLLLRTGRAPAQ
jgi:hypothetical protein